MAEAVPDPEMKEMFIMSYTRLRSVGSQPSVPRRNDFIEVLWCIDDVPGLPEKWCPAEVLHVTSSLEQDSLGFGIILYLPGETWEEQSHNVEFLPNNKLRVRPDEDRHEEGERGQESDPIDNAPKLNWRFSDTPDEQPMPDDSEWTPRDYEPNCKHSKDSDLGHRVSADHSELERLRQGHASLQVEVQKLKREVATLWKQLSTSSSLQATPNAIQDPGNVLPRLRYKLALRMQAALHSQRTFKKRKVQDSEDILASHAADGFHVGVVRARVECTLQEFEHIARGIQVMTTTNTAAVYFFPSFSYTQIPNLSSTGFRILFSTFSSMLDHIGITSAADKLEMSRKCGSGSQGELLRIMCTYSLNNDDEKKPALVFLGTSCGDEDIDHTEIENVEAPQLFPVLLRKSREWNKVDNRFSHDLERREIALPVLRESASELQAFSLSWKRSQEVGYRSWSKCITQPAQVFGSLQVALPFIQTQGRYMCTEVGGLATDETWSEIFTK